MENIVSKIEFLMFNYLIADDSIISDEGTFNIPMQNHNNQRYSFIDDKNYGERSDIEEKKIVFLNETMEILENLHAYIRGNDLYENPIFFNKQVLQSKLEAELSVNLDEEDSNEEF